MSPTRPTVRPSIRPLARRIVSMSSRPCVGCSCGAVAGVDDRGAEVLRQQVRGAGRGVADHHHVGPHGLDVLGRVDERLALGQARDAGGEVLRVGREPLGRQAEAGPRAGRVLEEQVEDDPARQRGDLLAAPGRDLGERLGRVEDADDLLARQVFQPEQVLAVPGRRRARCGREGPRPWSRRSAPPGLAYPSPSRRRPAPRIGPIAADPHDLVHRVDRPDPDPHPLSALGRDAKADDVGLDGDLAAAAIDQDRQPAHEGRPRSQTAFSAARTVRPV